MKTIIDKNATIKYIDLFAGYEYSKDDSLVVYEAFLIQNGYSDSSIKNKLFGARGIHKKFPALSWLQNYVDKNGITHYFDKDKSAYLHFLCIVGLISIKAENFFQTNPRTTTKLVSWYEPYFDVLGISRYLNATAEVTGRINNREINVERIISKTERMCVYFIMRYHLNNIYDVTESQWIETIRDVKRISARLQNIMPHTIMAQVFFESGTMNDAVLGYYREYTEASRSYDGMPEIKPIVEKYIDYISGNCSRRTLKQHKEALDSFFRFAKEKNGFASLKDVNRKLIYDYKVSVLSKGCTGSYNESMLYGLRKFLVFVEANTKELAMDGYKVPQKKIVVKKDFKIRRSLYLPKPIDDRVMNLMLDELAKHKSKSFRLAFLLMLSTGIATADLMALKHDCIEQKADGSYTMKIFRVKKRKYYEVKVRQETVDIVRYLQSVNSQIRPISHPDGGEAIYLINDGGHKLTYSWFTEKFRTMKKKIAEENPELKDVIMAATPHKLRHTFATRQRDNGADIYTLANLLGHESIITTQKYVKESDRLKEQYIKRLNQAYACDVIDDIAKLTETEKGLATIGEMLEHSNDMGIGLCLARKGRNCPFFYKCLDCIYLCSTQEDIPEMMSMLESLKGEYDDLVEQKRDEEAEICKRRIMRLTGKIIKLEDMRGDKFYEKVDFYR